MILDNTTYYTPEANAEYMSCSQFKAFLHCEAAAMAELTGESRREDTTALLTGSYVDAFYEGTLDQFREQHPELFKKDGTLKAEYQTAESAIERTKADPLFTEYMSGEKQRIFTGEIGGVPYKIKVDSYREHLMIVDLKCVRDFEPVWNAETRRKEHFIEYWGYHTQGAIYREIVRQNTGETLPFYIAAVTKEKSPDIEIFSVPDEALDEQLEVVEQLSPRFSLVKHGVFAPQRCGKCAYCRATKVLTAPVDYRTDNTEPF
ncbi:MAG TPA: hypothetical protein DIV52_02660 [Ruminococcaceae bacterium]|jgi:hypothetical protein|nr:hypothetical protein [Oscillospiraceae bacterium]